MKKAIIFDGFRWHVRRIRVIEHDCYRDEKVYRCDIPIGNDYENLADVPEVTALLPNLMDYAHPSERQEPPEDKVMHYCGFCGKDRQEIERLIEGPDTAICNECIELMHDMLQHPPDPGFKSFNELRLKMGRPKK